VGVSSTISGVLVAVTYITLWGFVVGAWGSAGL
jgi:hypothetical protein